MTTHLTPKQQRFVEEYLVDLNATRAATRAGYSERTADRIGHQVLRRPAVAAAVAEGMKARSDKVGADAEWVLRRLVAEAEADMADLYDDHGNLRHPKDWPQVWRTGLVVGIETSHVRKDERDDEGKPVYAAVRKVKLTDRIKQVELIGRHVNVNAFREQVGVSAPDGGPVQMAHAVELTAIKKALERVRAMKMSSETGAARGGEAKGEKGEAA